MEVLLLPVDQEVYALPMDCFLEVIAQPKVTRLPTAPGVVLGLVNVRGEIVPLFDLAGLMSTGRTQIAPFAAVVEVGGARAAFATTAVPQSEVLGERTGDAPQPMARGVYRQGDRLVTLLDLASTIGGAHR
jgi:purine-binding chemotaxis protein CheW